MEATELRQNAPRTIAGWTTIEPITAEALDALRGQDVLAARDNDVCRLGRVDRVEAGTHLVFTTGVLGGMGPDALRQRRWAIRNLKTVWRRA